MVRLSNPSARFGLPGKSAAAGMLVAITVLSAPAFLLCGSAAVNPEAEPVKLTIHVMTLNPDHIAMKMSQAPEGSAEELVYGINLTRILDYFMDYHKNKDKIARLYARFVNDSPENYYNNLDVISMEIAIYRETEELLLISPGELKTGKATVRIELASDDLTEWVLAEAPHEMLVTWLIRTRVTGEDYRGEISTYEGFSPLVFVDPEKHILVFDETSGPFALNNWLVITWEYT